MKLKYRIKMWLYKREQQREKRTKRIIIKRRFEQWLIGALVGDRCPYAFVFPDERDIFEELLKDAGVNYTYEEMCKRNPKHKEIRYEIYPEHL